MFRTSLACTAAALAITLASGAAMAQRPGEGPAYGRTGNSDAPVTATTGESGTRGSAPTARNQLGANPMDQSNSASARGNPYVATPPTAQNQRGANPMDQSNSASARGGPGTGMAGRANSTSNDMAGNYSRRPMARGARTAANNSNGAYMGGGAVYERMPDGSLRPMAAQ